MKPFAVYGSKPRNSKTSKRETLSGLPVFLHVSKGETAGNMVVYHDKKPFPRLFVVTGLSYWDMRDKAEKFISDNYFTLQEKISSMNPYMGLNRK